jgi:Rrf2 family cysteine metabolism transcriptional repressor
MKISTRGRYGLTIMMELARCYGGRPVSLKKIAERHQLSENYLEQLVSPLRNGGLIVSIRGAYGGYQLTRDPETITVGEILYLLEGPISPCDFDDEEEPAKLYLWKRIRDAIAEVLETVTLKEMIDYRDPNDKDHYMFYI